MKVGDYFSSGTLIFKIKEYDGKLTLCDVLDFTGRKVGVSFEHSKTILKMRKLKPLEKELL